MSGRVLVCLLIAGACALPRPAPPAPVRQTALGLRLSTMTLGNGLRVVIIDDPHASEVQVTMRYGIGASDDLDSPGLAHLVEHLMFQQTLGAQTLRAHLDDNATYANAFTTYDATTYISRARPEFLDKLLSIEAVRIGFRCTSITDSAFEREREVVKQEVRLRDDATELVVALHSAIYPAGHPYRQPVGGTVESVGATTKQQACTFADSYYATSNAVLVISGHLSPDAVKTSLGKFLARIARRSAASPAPVPQPTKSDGAAPAPLDDEALLLTWHMPPDPYAQIGVRALAKAAVAALDSEIHGQVDYIELGDVRAGVFGYLLRPGKDETIAEVQAIVKRTLDELPQQLDDRSVSAQVFDALRQRAIYEQYASLEDAWSRDQRIAAYVLAGREPSAALSDEFRALRNLTQSEAVTITTTYLAITSASTIRLTPSSAKKRGHEIEVKSAVHDMGQRRNPPDPALARSPESTLTVPSVPMKTRVLPNGLKVVMLPITSVPTVDVRLVFGAGSADEPADRRGTAFVAAHALSFDLRHINDLWNFAVAGGSLKPQVTADSTSFVVRGVDMHIDYLLAGLRRWAIDGRYASWADRLVEAMKTQHKRDDDDEAVADAWFGALYGDQHPYGRRRFMRYVSPNLTVEDVERFRAAYYTPNNATLIIAGHVDVDLTDRWVEYLFADWRGTAQPRASAKDHLVTASLIKPEELSQVQLRLALPCRGTRAQLLVLGEMLNEIAGDVRHQLGAAYGFDAALDDSRLATHLMIAGWIDPTRTDEVVRLLRDRTAALRSDPNTASRAFVAARRRVVIALTSITGSASALASRVETDVELGRSPLSDLQTAREVQALTIDDIQALLADLDLARGAMLMRGPGDSIKAAFAQLGRQPTLVQLDTVGMDAFEEPPSTKNIKSHEQRIRFDEIEDAMTDRGFDTPSRIELTASATAGIATVNNVVPPGESTPIEGGPLGLAISGEVGYRISQLFSAGLNLATGRYWGTYEQRAINVVIARPPYGVIPLDAGAYVHVRARDHIWGGLTFGLHDNGIRFGSDRTWTSSAGAGAEIGYDALHSGHHWLAAYGRVTTSFGSDVGFGVLSLGFAYHR